MPRKLLLYVSFVLVLIVSSIDAYSMLENTVEINFDLVLEESEADVNDDNINTDLISMDYEALSVRRNFLFSNLSLDSFNYSMYNYNIQVSDILKPPPQL
ncbi:MAG: hypothetical protein N4A49_10950 [Marinifilaceae bacterium]|jgi:hypothetical protein|nr:hypothetical protein [Marinifilaceae bacterium]